MMTQTRKRTPIALILYALFLQFELKKGFPCTRANNQEKPRCNMKMDSEVFFRIRFLWRW